MNKSKISIIIPTYNESQTIGSIVSRILELYPEVEVLVVDDGSTDDTGVIAKDAGAQVYSHPYNVRQTPWPNIGRRQRQSGRWYKVSGLYRPPIPPACRGRPAG